MAKLSLINREKKRINLVKKYKTKREYLKKILSDSSATIEEKSNAIRILDTLPKNSSPYRIRNRCSLTGRPRGYFRKFGLSRNKLREIAMKGEIPGIIKASW